MPINQLIEQPLDPILRVRLRKLGALLLNTQYLYRVFGLTQHWRKLPYLIFTASFSRLTCNGHRQNNPTHTFDVKNSQFIWTIIESNLAVARRLRFYAISQFYKTYSGCWYSNRYPIWDVWDYYREIERKRTFSAIDPSLRMWFWLIGFCIDI